MKLFIAENIKKFRKEKGITQEALADFMGVTFQSVSKWECGMTYPDLELIPSLANFFGVTMDELIGSDKIKNEELINDYLDEYDRLEHLTPQLYIEKNILAEKAYKEFPYDWRIINMYRNSLFCGYTEPFQPEKARHICEMILESCNIDEYRYYAIHSLIYAAHLEKNEEEMEELISRLPNDIYILQSEMREDYAFRENKAEKFMLQTQKNLMTYLEYAFGKMMNLFEDWRNNLYTLEQRIVICNKALAMIDLFFEDGNYGLWTHDIAIVEESFAREYFRLNDIENGFVHFEKAVECCVKSAKKPERFQYTSLCFDRVVYEKPKHTIEDSVEMYLGRLGHPVYDRVRDDERFKRIISLLNV